MNDEYAEDDLDELLRTGCGDPHAELKKQSATGTADLNPATGVLPTGGPPKVTTIAAGSYAFPSVLPDAIGLAMHSQDDLHNRLDELCNAQSFGSKRPYSAIRKEVCAISIAMNIAGLRPPRFRHMRKVSKVPKPGVHEEDRHALSNDRKLIDLHWLHQHCERRELDDSEFRSLLMAPKFDFELASQFCARSWTTEVRVVKIMVLTDFEQWQLSALVGQSIQKRAEQIRLDSKAVEKRIREVAVIRPQLRGHGTPLTALWKAKQICAGMPHSDKLIGQFYAWQMGVARLAKSTLSKKLKLLDEVVPGSHLIP